MDNKHRYESTNHFKYGEWIYESEIERIEICLYKSNTSYYSKFNKELQKEVEQEEFELHGHWFDKWLIGFSHPRRFFIEYANAEILIFGEERSATIGDDIWQHTFSRKKKN